MREKTPRALFLFALIAALLQACSLNQNPPPAQLTKAQNDYWLQGKAEVTRFNLTQARYGNLNRGELILIMVTEPFNTAKQVKSESSPGAGDQLIFKAQTVRKFVTGIYDYTMTTTSFKPVADAEKSLKINGTSVEWCGQTFYQLNRKGDDYRVESRSYFEAESDENYALSGAISEDEIWQRIRLNPAALPLGRIRIIPALVSARLRHRRLAAEDAVAGLNDYRGSLVPASGLRVFSLTYAGNSAAERHVEFIFESAFPYKIRAQTEEYMDGFEKPKKLKTVAVAANQMMVDYWRTHNPEHEKLRNELGVR